MAVASPDKNRGETDEERLQLDSSGVRSFVPLSRRLRRRRLRVFLRHIKVDSSPGRTDGRTDLPLAPPWRSRSSRVFVLSKYEGRNSSFVRCRRRARRISPSLSVFANSSAFDSRANIAGTENDSSNSGLTNRFLSVKILFPHQRKDKGTRSYQSWIHR